MRFFSQENLGPPHPQVLKRGRQTKRSVELHPDATVQESWVERYR